MSTIAKGNRNELKARKILQEDGYITEKKNRNRYESPDFWKLFDIIAIHKKKGKVKLIQVKSNISDFYRARKEISQWRKDTKLTNKISCEVWLKQNRKDWRIEIL